MSASVAWLLAAFVAAGSLLLPWRPVVVVTAEPPGRAEEGAPAPDGRTAGETRQGSGGSPGSTRQWLGILPVREGEAFGLRFVHSVDGLPVEDDYTVWPVGPGQALLVQAETRLLSFGAGMGAIPGEGRAVEEGTWLRITAMGRSIGPALVLRVGSVSVDHRLLYRGCSLPLSERWAAWRVRLEARSLPGWVHGLLSARNGVWRWERVCPRPSSG